MWRLDAIADAADLAVDRVLAVFNGAITLCAIGARGLWETSPELKLAAFPVLLALIGIPFGYSGYLSMTFKTATQMTACQGDLSAGVAAARGTPQQQFDAIQAAFTRSPAGYGNVDPPISNVDFVQQQHARWRDGNP